MEGGITPQVGEKVTVFYTIRGRGKHIAYNVDE